MKICFLENTNFSYNSNDLDSPLLRGSETTLINLSSELNKLGHKLTVINNCPRNEIIDSIRWLNFQSYNENETFDIAISNNDMRFFEKINAKKKVLISHSLQSLEKFIRKKQLISYLRHKPIVATLGNYHFNNRNKLLRLFGNINLDIGIKNIFFSTNVDVKKKNQAIFTSSSYRNLDLLIDIWKKKINFDLPKTNLLITPTNQFNLSHNIKFRKKGTTDELINDLVQSKVYLIPGHKSELCCQAVEEAKELCIPTVTLGIGSLSEQVENEKSGLISKNINDFSNNIIQLFKDEKLYNKIKNYLKKNRGKKKWSSISKNFINDIIQFKS